MMQGPLSRPLVAGSRSSPVEDAACRRSRSRGGEAHGAPRVNPWSSAKADKVTLQGGLCALGPLKSSQRLASLSLRPMISIAYAVFCLPIES